MSVWPSQELYTYSASRARRPSHPTSSGSSPGGPTTFHRNHHVISLRPGDHSPLVHTMAVAQSRDSHLLTVQQASHKSEKTYIRSHSFLVRWLLSQMPIWIS